MSGRRDCLRRSQRPEEDGTIGVANTEYDGLYDGAVIPRSGYNYYRHPNHFRLWREAYAPYLKQLYVAFTNAIVTPDNSEKLSKATFSEFIEFVYRNSSGYITEFL